MLEQFDKAVRAMRAGESKTFPLQFPADYHGKDVAGKEADFMVTMKKIEAQHLPAVDEAFAKSLGIADPSVEALRADVKKNLRGIFDEAFDFVWEEVEKSLKTSYKNGYEVGQKDAKDGSPPAGEQAKSTPRRNWRRGSRAAATEGGAP